MSLGADVAQPAYIQQYGIPVTVFVSDSTLRTEVWRAPQSAGAPNDGAAVLAFVLRPSPTGGVVFIDRLPNDGAVRYYKCRHVNPKGDASTFTAYSEALTPILLTGENLGNPMAAFGAIVDQLPSSTLYEIRFAGNYTDPDTLDGMQSYIDFPATTNFMRIGQTPKAIESSTNVNPSVVTITNHGFQTGDRITIRGHLVNTAVNGSNWQVTRLTSNTFSVPVLGNGNGVATGHAVRLSLTIGPTGDLSVYANITASTLVVTGPATFNAAATFAGSTLVRQLQHSTAGAYGDTTVKRVLMENDALKLLGDAGTGTNNEVVRLGSHSIASIVTARTTANQGTSKGWTDPDGSSNGKNVLTVNSLTGFDVVGSASRLYCTIGDPTGGTNADAYDDNYTLKFDVKADPNTLTGSESLDVSVTIETSPDNSTYTPLAGSYDVSASVIQGPTTLTFNPTIVFNGTTPYFRLKMSVTINYSVKSTRAGIGTVLVTSNAFPSATDVYPVTWGTASSPLARRGLKLFKTLDGASKPMPHAYMEPHTTEPAAADVGKGEVWFQDAGGLACLAYHDGYSGAGARVKKLFSGPFVIGSLNNITTTSAEAKLATITVPNSALNGNNDVVRLTFTVRMIGGGTGSLRLDFGGTQILVSTVIAANSTLTGIATISRTSGTTQVAHVSYWIGTAATIVQARTSPAETLTNAIAIDIYGGRVTSGTLEITSVIAEAIIVS